MSAFRNYIPLSFCQEIPILCSVNCTHGVAHGPNINLSNIQCKFSKKLWCTIMWMNDKDILHLLGSIPWWKSVHLYTPCPWGWPYGLREQCREMESCAVSWKNPFICCQYACGWGICLFVNLCFTFSFPLLQTTLQLQETFHSLAADDCFLFFLSIVIGNFEIHYLRTQDKLLLEIQCNAHQSLWLR